MTRDTKQFDRIYGGILWESDFECLSARQTGSEDGPPMAALHGMLDGQEYVITITPTELGGMGEANHKGGNR